MAIWHRIAYSAHGDMAIWRRTTYSAHGDMAPDCPFCSWRYGAGLPILLIAIWRGLPIQHMAIWRRTTHSAHGDMAIWRRTAHSAHSDMARIAYSVHGDVVMDCLFCLWRYSGMLPVQHMAIYSETLPFSIWRYGDMLPIQHMAIWRYITCSAHGDMAIYCLFSTWRYGDMLPIQYMAMLMAIWRRITILHMIIWYRIAHYAHSYMAPD